MSQSLVPFNFDDNLLRSLMIDDSPWFVATDIAKILEYRNAPDMVRMLDPELHRTGSQALANQSERLRLEAERQRLKTREAALQMLNRITTERSHPVREALYPILEQDFQALGMNPEGAGRHAGQQDDQGSRQHHAPGLPALLDTQQDGVRSDL